MMDEYGFDDSPIISSGDKSDAIGCDMENNTKSSGKRSRSQVSEGIRHNALSCM